MNTRRRNIFIVVGGLALLLIIAVAAGKGRHSSAPTVKVQTISLTAYATKLPENGVVQHPRLQAIPAQISGNIGSVLVRPGDHVTAGQLLATINNPQILSTAQTSADAMRSAQAHAQGASLQAQATLIAARERLTQAQADMANGSQSGLGYGGGSAADQRANADANLANAETNLHEARRLYDADVNLYNQKAISRDAVDQAKAKLDQTQVSYNQAKLARQSLGAQLGRSRQVLADNLRSAQQAYAQAQAAADVSAAYADAARAGHDYQYASQQAAATQVRAPFEGIILSQASESSDALRPLQPGDAVQLGQTLFTMSSNNAFIVRAKVDEQDIINVHLGQRANVTGEDFPGKTLTGHVVAISPIAQKSDDPSSTARQIITTIRLDASPSYLRDGMSVDVDILTTDIRQAIVVPNVAIVRDHGKTYVYVVDKGIAHKRGVRLGQANDAKSIVRSGLRPGDQIVAEKSVEIVDGGPVAAAPSASPKTP